MNTIGKKILGTIVGLALVIAIWEVKSRLGLDSSSDEGEKITQEEVDLYLRVMRTTVERVNNPHPEELGVVEAFNQIPNVRTVQAGQLTSDQKNTVMDALRMTDSLDFVVADELQVGADNYENAKYAIEEILAPPTKETPEVPAELTAEQKKALESHAEVLNLHVGEIRELQQAFFNNPLRKSVHGE